MISSPFFLLQIGLAFVFVWTGILIFRNTKEWADKLRESWVYRMLPMSPESAMKATAIFDIAVGGWLLSGMYLWLAALIAALHIVQVLIVRGIMGPEYRDVGLLTAAVALMMSVS